MVILLFFVSHCQSLFWGIHIPQGYGNIPIKFLPVTLKFTYDFKRLLTLWDLTLGPRKMISFLVSTSHNCFCENQHFLLQSSTFKSLWLRKIETTKIKPIFNFLKPTAHTPFPGLGRKCEIYVPEKRTQGVWIHVPGTVKSKDEAPHFQPQILAASLNTHSTARALARGLADFIWRNWPLQETYRHLRLPTNSGLGWFLLHHSPMKST